MPSIFVNLDAKIEGAGLSTSLGAQVDNLTGIVTKVTGLIKHPPQSLADLGTALNELPLPSIAVSGNFAATLNAIRRVVPTDLSSVTGGLSAGLEGLSQTVGAGLAQPLKDAVDAVLAIYRLTQLDWTCRDMTTSGGGSAGAGSPGSPAPGGAPAPGAAPSPASGQPGLQAASAQLDVTGSLLDRAPSPFTVEAALGFLDKITRFEERTLVFPFAVPLLDELADPLQTLHAWRAMSSAEIAAQIAATLQELGQFVRRTAGEPLAALSEGLASAAAQLNTQALAQIAADLATGLGQLRSAVNGGNLSGTAAAVALIGQRLDEYDALRPTLSTGVLAQLPALEGRLACLADDLAGHMGVLLASLQPSGALNVLDQFTAPATATEAALLAEIQGRLQPLADWVKALVDKLDLKALEAPLKAVADGARGAVDGLETSLADVAVQVRALFAQVETLLQQVDIQALTGEVKKAIQDFAAQLTKQLTDLFGPVRKAVEDVVTSIGGAVDAFKPEQVVEALRKAVTAITEALEDPAVKQTLQQIRGAIDTATRQLQQLSFAPVTDQVIAVIEEIKAALESIDTSKLNVALQVALQAAVQVLPKSLEPVTEPFVNKFGEMVAEGPAPLLEKVKEQPEKLLQKVRSFEPAALIGEKLSKPYQDLLGQMEGFKPTQLLKPVDEEFNKLKERLKKEANPAAPLQLLEQPFDQFLDAFRRFQPEEMVKPLEEVITGVIDRILKALPVDEVLQQVDGVLKQVEQVVAFARKLTALLQRVRGLLSGFADSHAQVDAWIDSILDRVEAIGDTAALQPRFTDLAAALDEIKAGPLAARFRAAANPVLAALTVLDPRAKLAALVQAHGMFPRAALAALPDSPQKAAITAVLNRFDPLSPAFGAPYQALESLRQALSTAATRLEETLAGWDARYHAADGALAGFRLAGATPAELRQWIFQSLEPPVIRPLKLLFGVLEALGTPLGALLSMVEALLTHLEGKVANLLLGPDSLGGIRDAVKQLIQRLRDFNLGFLRDSLKEVFAQVCAKVEALNPAQLRQTIEAAFDEVLATLTVSQVLPKTALEKLDTDYAAVVGKLKLLDPKTLVADVVQPEFETKVIPLLEAFDVTKLLTALLDFVESLKGQLRRELGRVNDSYRAMLEAVPPISGVSVEVDIGISW